VKLFGGRIRNIPVISRVIVPYSAEFPISGLRYVYGSINYQFLDGRQNLEVHEEILLERIHDAISSLAGRVRRADAKA